MENKPKKRNLNNYSRFSSIAFQMIAILLLGAFGGIKLDEWVGTSPLFTVVLLLVALAGAMYIVIRKLS